MKIKYVISTLGAVLFVMEFHNNQLDFFNSIPKVLFFLILVILSYVVIFFSLKYKIFKLNNMAVIPSKNTMSTINTIFFTLLFCGTYAFVSLKLSSTTKPFSNVNYCSARFSDLEKLNIFIFPFYGFDICEKNAPCDNAFLKGLSNLGVDEIEVIVCDSFPSKNITQEIIDSIIQTKKADLVVWGDYEKPVCTVDTTKVYLNYKIGMEHLIGGFDLITKDNIISPLLDISSGKALGNLDELVYWLLASIFIKKGDLEKSLELLEKINIDQSNDSTVIRGLLENIGTLHVETGGTQKGLGYLLKALSFDPQSIFVNFNLAVAYHKIGNLAKAYEYAKKSENILQVQIPQMLKFPTYGSIGYELINLFMELNVTRQDWLETQRYASQLVNFYPNHKRANQCLSVCYSEQGITELALFHLNKAIPLCTTEDELEKAYEFKGELFFIESKFDSSYFYYKKAFASSEKAGKLSFERYMKKKPLENYLMLTKKSLKDLRAIYYGKNMDTIIYTLKSGKLLFVAIKDIENGLKLYREEKIK